MEVYIGYIFIPILLLIFGVVLYVKPPQNINSLIGFRTKKSTSSQKNWDLAQRLCAKSLIFISIVSAIFFLILRLSGIYSELTEDSRAWFLLVPAVLLILSIPYVNSKLSHD
ncbi:SdpI family protein [Kallipyga massiliensis]|uniref:SdpI family protein n=1 Tax=Kallipyga massiliensis TaxID=1472764 RepID=UPI0009DACDF1